MSVGNYRGIRLSRVVGKINEKVVCDRMILLADVLLMDEKVVSGCVEGL